MPAVSTKYATIEQDSASKPPTMTPGEITPAVMRSFETKCLGYFENKDIPDERQVHNILVGLQDSHVQDWINVDCDRFLALAFPEFMTEFCVGYLPEDWEEVTRIELLGMTQNKSHFWDFAVQVQSKNSLLCNTPLHLDEDKLHHHIESGMNQKLVLHCRLKKSSKIEGFNLWITEVKHIDDLVHAERTDFKSLAKATQDIGRRNNNLAEPSHCVNTNYNSSSLSANTASLNSARQALPRLTEAECQLLYDNEGCLKC